MDRPLWISHAWSPKNKGLFRIGLMDRPQGLDLWTVPRGSATRGTLKIRGCSGLDSWTVPEDWTRGPSLVDRPSVKP